MPSFWKALLYNPLIAIKNQVFKKNWVSKIIFFNPLDLFIVGKKVIKLHSSLFTISCPAVILLTLYIMSCFLCSPWLLEITFQLNQYQPFVKRHCLTRAALLFQVHQLWCRDLRESVCGWPATGGGRIAVSWDPSQLLRPWHRARIWPRKQGYKYVRQ